MSRGESAHADPVAPGGGKMTRNILTVCWWRNEYLITLQISVNKFPSKLYSFLYQIFSL